jgi:thiol:disulfide interchange protein DsbD
MMNCFLRILLIVYCIGYFPLQAQTKRAKFSVSTTKKYPKKGETIQLVLEAQIFPNWKLYASDVQVVPGPKPAYLEIQPHASFRLLGGLKSINPHKERDAFWKGQVIYFEKKARFTQAIQILESHTQITGKIIYQLCTTNNSSCVQYQDTFKVQLH